MSSNLSYTRREDEERKKVDIHKSLPVGTGFGYRVNAENSSGRNDLDESNTFDGILQYQNSHGIYEAGYYKREETEDYRLSVAGGIGYINKSIFFSRPINDSFAKVKVEDLEGVRVYYYGNEVGRTDRNGSVIIPGLLSFHDNKVDIENRDIPINYSIPSLTKYVSPPYRSGSLVKFDVSRIQGIAGIIYIADKGKEIPVESAVMLIQIKDGVVEGLIGRDGEFYLENIPSGKHPAKILYRGKECKFDIIIPDSEEIMMDLGKLTCKAG
ncbi:MAG: fimbria/pilus outer membrane usher protein [Candidatus Mariimomonas ferrooxydans]